MAFYGNSHLLEDSKFHIHTLHVWHDDRVGRDAANFGASEQDFGATDDAAGIRELDTEVVVVGEPFSEPSIINQQHARDRQSDQNENADLDLCFTIFGGHVRSSINGFP